MNWFMLMMAAALAGPVEHVDAGALSGSIIDEFVVLDVSGDHAAIKLVSHVDPEMAGPDFGEPVNCEYAGMEKLPYSDVTLAALDLKTGKLSKFTVYEGVFEKADCMSMDASKKVLAAAKAKFLELGLDIAKRPSAVSVSGDSVEIGGQRFGIRSSETREDEAMQGTATVEITRGTEVVYRSSTSFNLAMAGSGKSTISGAYTVGDKVVFVVRFDGFSGRGGSSTAYSLSAPVALGTAAP